MKLSVIIPTYNSQETIKNCIESLIYQTYTDYEVLIMDGESQDNTLEIIRSFNDDRIIISSKKDKGVYDAMNKGIVCSKGEWLYFLGSDDKLYDENVFENIFKEVRISNPDIIYGDAYFVTNKCFYAGEFSRERLVNERNICHQSIFYKKKLFERLGYYNLEFFINADWDFNIRCFSTPDFKIKYIALPIVYYNDLTGLSSNGRQTDMKFHAISKAYTNKRVKDLESFLKDQEKSVISIFKTKEYRLGSLLINPLKKIKRFFE